jgi:nucleotidyltransferase/DNA polymerase involved in DNA repair
MYRIVCIRIPQFQIAVHQKHERELKGKPLVILANKANLTAYQSGREIVSRQKDLWRTSKPALPGIDTQQKNTAANSGITAPTFADFSAARNFVLMCSPEAEHKEIRPGMKLAEARSLCSNLLWREYDEKLYIDAQSKLLRALISCSPKVTAEEPGVFILDATGRTHLGGENRLCKNLLSLSSQCGFVNCHAGLADSFFTALVATRFKHRRWCIVPPGQDALFLAPLLLRHLPLSREMHEALVLLGIKTLGQLAQLPVASLSKRFGNEGILAWNLAQGIDPRSPMLPPLTVEFHSHVDLGYPVQQLNQTQFIVKSMLNHLTTRLKQEALWAEELEIIFYNDNDRFHERTIKLIRPSSNPKFLLEVVKLSLEAQALTREFTALTLIVSRFTEESWEQMYLSDSTSPAANKQLPPLARSGGYTRLINNSLSSLQLKNKPLPESLIWLLQRFKTRLGDDSVVYPAANDQYFPESAGTWIPVLQNDRAQAVVAVDIDHIQNFAGPKALAGGLVIRKAEQPIPVLVKLKDSSPSAVTLRGTWHQIKAITTPECLSGLWWDRFIRKSFYVAMIEQQSEQWQGSNTPRSLVLLVNDHQLDCWQIEGFFD